MAKILIVEDDQLLSAAFSDIFEREGHSVLTARDGQTALDLALAEHPDVILLDILLPKMSGMVTLKKLRQDNWGKTAEVIIFTNISDPEAPKQVKEYGVDAYFLKADMSREQVIKAVEGRLKK